MLEFFRTYYWIKYSPHFYSFSLEAEKRLQKRMRWTKVSESSPLHPTQYYVIQAIMGRAARSVLREIKRALNLQPWSARCTDNVSDGAFLLTIGELFSIS